MECIHVPSPGGAEVITGPHSFGYDHVFGGGLGKRSDLLYDECVAPLVDGLFGGYNATVFAYGQTGSGKTYTMGSAFPQTCSEEERGVIPKAMDAIFRRIASMRDSKDFTIKVGFVEIHKEEIKDLLAMRTTTSSAVHIREVPGGGIMLAGANEVEVTNQEEMIAVLERGTCLRATGATGMNQRSSRSHAIFTISVEQRSPVQGVGQRSRKSSEDTEGKASEVNESDEDDDEDNDEDDLDDGYLCAKMHLVDLAGSERVKRTKTEGQRLQEGIKINKGLLALGNVINALAENKQHVPYRDSKLTRMLQDSLGGNSRTLMIACVSPADVNMEESLNSLRYASRARAIKNKPVVNRDPVAAQIASLRQQLALVRAENADLRRKLGISPTENLQDQQSLDDVKLALESTRGQLGKLTRDLGLARKANDELKKDLQEQAEERLIACMQRDKMAQALAANLGEDEASATIAAIGASMESESVETNLLKRVQELEEENRILRFGGNNVSPVSLRIAGADDQAMDSPLRVPTSPLSPFSNVNSNLDEYEEMDEEAVSRRRVIDSMNEEMDKLQSDLEAKEAAIRKVSNHASMQVAYTAHLQEIQKERDSLAKERRALLSKIKDLQSASAEERMQLERMYKGKLRELDQKVKAAERKEQKIRALEATQQKAAQKVKDLEGEVRSIKVQKAQLMRQADKAGKEYVQWKRDRDKEVQKLKRENQAAEVKLLKMEAQTSRQQAYLRRKIEEAAAARKRLATLEGRRRGTRSSRSSGTVDVTVSAIAPDTTGAQSSDADLVTTTTPSSSQPSAIVRQGSLPADLGEWLENELDSCCSSIELQKVLEGEKAARSEVARDLRQVEKKLAALKNPKWWGVLSPGANKDQKALEQQKRDLLKKAEVHGKEIQEAQLLLMQSRAAEEEKGRGAADPSRFDGISDVSDAHRVLVSLFMAASRYKTQSYESQSALSEISEEMDMLRLKLEVAEAERLEQQMQLDELRAAMEAAEVAAVQRTLTPMSAPRSTRSVRSEHMTMESIKTEDSDVKEVLQELDSMFIGGDDDDGDDDNEADEDDVTSGVTTSVRSLSAMSPKSRISSTFSDTSGASDAISDGSSRRPGQMLLPGEIAVLGHINSARATSGLDPVYVLHSRDLIAQLEQIPDWHDGSKFSAASSKSKAELIADYLTLIAGQPTASLKTKTSSPLQGLRSILSTRAGDAAGISGTAGIAFNGSKSSSGSKIKAERASLSPSVVRSIDLTNSGSECGSPIVDARVYVSRSAEKKKAPSADRPRASSERKWIP